MLFYIEFCFACWMYEWLKIDNWLSQGKEEVRICHWYRNLSKSLDLHIQVVSRLKKLFIQVETWLKISDPSWRNLFYSSLPKIVFLVSFESCQVDCGIFLLSMEIPGPFQVCCSPKVCSRSSYPEGIYRKLQVSCNMLNRLTFQIVWARQCHY